MRCRTRSLGHWSLWRRQTTSSECGFRHGDGFAVLLSGSGSDGVVGAKAVKERGGLILVQDPSEAAHSGMPRAAIATGIADIVLPVRELVGRLAALARARQHVVIGAQVTGDAAEEVPVEEESALRDVLDVLRKRTGHDFSKYKRSTVLRRLSRRMQLAHRRTIAEYLEYLRASVPEAHALLNDLLISVTTFFRDPDAWAALQAQVIAPLVEQSDPDIQVRAWVPGCATGEEAYSLAMLFHEEFAHHDRPPHFIVFASDVDDTALAVAREGLYPQAISADVPDARLHRYFRPDDDHYRVLTEIRDHLVFAAHSILRDPPFSRLHLISCRNLLIYLDRDLQSQVMSIFRYACRDEGTLFLGASESANEELFHTIDKKHRIFAMTVNFSLLALDQIVNNAATILHMSSGQFNIPLAIRMTTGAGRQLAAQHSHSLEGWYAHIPGIKILTPATLEDARGMLWTALEDPDPVLIFENGLLYNMEGELAADAGPVEISRAAIRRPGKDISLITYGGTLFKTLQAAEELGREHNIDAEVIDLRTLRPLDSETIVDSVTRTHRAVIIDEGWKTGSISAEIMARIMENAVYELDAPVARVCTWKCRCPIRNILKMRRFHRCQRSSPRLAG